MRHWKNILCVLIVVVIESISLFFSTDIVHASRSDKCRTDDVRISNIHREESVSNVLLFVLAILIPILMVPLSAFLLKKHRWRKIGYYLLGLVLSLVLVHFFTTILKLLAGRLRPDYLDRCDPDADYSECICASNDEKVLESGHRSFPSGHSSTSFAGLVFVSLYLKFVVFPNRGSVFAPWLIISFFPVTIALWIAHSRLRDNRHSEVDVGVGSVLGCVGAIASFLWTRNALKNDDTIPTE